MNMVESDFKRLGMKVGTFTAIELKTAYRLMAKKVHPDKSGVHGAGSSKEFVELHAAYKRMTALVAKVAGLDVRLSELVAELDKGIKASNVSDDWFGIKWRRVHVKF